ncbi:FAD-dependent oxidoreductase [Pedobacter sp. P351]|uniref:FAD-dependent oxidoreductase n=1 Tax=Pedobacter superstes TaxID=3133441 RepID=UPI0030A994EB
MKTADNIRIGIPRDSITESIWQENIEPVQSDISKHNPETTYDVLIIGGGITGITTAMLLQEAGKNCILAEAHTIGYGTTGGTTAHINTFLDIGYDHIEKNFGEEASKTVAMACKEAIELVAGFVTKYKIDCDFAYKKGFLYAETEKEASDLDKLSEASIKAGVPVQPADNIPVPVPFKKAVVFDRQAQIHPLKYIYALALEFTKKGGLILQNTLIQSTEKSSDFHIAKADNTSIKAKKIVYATHIPPGINLLHFRCAPYRSYSLGVRLAGNNYPFDLAYDMKVPYHYFRTHDINGQQYLVIGGEDHKTGHGNPDQAFQSLEEYVHHHYRGASVEFKWSAQYYVPADGLPYIGKLPGFDNDVYVSTGFNGNGITLGSISGKILRDLVLDYINPYADLFSPGRIKPVAGFTDFVKENADVAYRFFADRLSAKDIHSLNEIPLDSGALVEYKNEKLAIYKDATGEIHALNPVCTHAKCIVNWNNSEKSWDCPCHGARYAINGEVLTGPASKGLQKVEIGQGPD